MTGTGLVNEIAEILEEDFSLNQVWSRAKLHDFISQDFHDMARQTESSHELVALTVYPSGASVLLTDTTSGVFFIRTTTYDIPTGTFSDADLLTGVTNPMSSGTPQMCVWEHDRRVTTGVSYYDPVLRFMPRFLASGTTVVVYAQTGVTTSQTIGDTIQARPIFLVLLKYLGLRDAYSMDSLLKDPSKSKTFGALADVVQGALKSLYGGRR